MSKYTERGRKQAFNDYSKDELVDIAMQYEDWVLDLRKELSDLQALIYLVAHEPTSETEIN
jgi:predicted alpha/beta hydrolase family esterase